MCASSSIQQIKIDYQIGALIIKFAQWWTDLYICNDKGNTIISNV